ncbi:fructose-6-phosphate aldolase [Agrilactobacillus composti DSM 18527 = JCM 14202]|uniref:Fructose-6-phosphate aldolase n=1 Tax=Agrilactobacillus composti DSM 18527 = JCM 14202 TaxID=1423734 RepID=A0A0R1XSB9_9LACO|nr:fructose-6-phosphate aldolase [Agrilactobacillus composti]KRM30907.1 fructose-6-phosphate aldolase [Agrilactobacillus composti DSM 18527 = JCM 14202]
MEFLLDTVHIPDIEKYNAIIPLSGVTSNPTICKKEGHFEFFDHMCQIRHILGPDKSLHVQVVGQTAEAMIADAHMILKEIDDQVFIKVPTNEAGLTAIKQLKHEGVHITATAIYTEFQGLLAIQAGADYIAPYYNRMANMNIDAAAVVQAFANAINANQANTKILAASFHNVAQVTTALACGAQAVTMGVDILKSGLGMPAIGQAVADFTQDWEENFGAHQTVASLPTETPQI